MCLDGVRECNKKSSAPRCACRGHAVSVALTTGGAGAVPFGTIPSKCCNMWRMLCWLRLSAAFALDHFRFQTGKLTLQCRAGGACGLHKCSCPAATHAPHVQRRQGRDCHPPHCWGRAAHTQGRAPLSGKHDTACGLLSSPAGLLTELLQSWSNSSSPPCRHSMP